MKREEAIQSLLRYTKEYFRMKNEGITDEDMLGAMEYCISKMVTEVERIEFSSGSDSSENQPARLRGGDNTSKEWQGKVSSSRWYKWILTHD